MGQQCRRQRPLEVKTENATAPQVRASIASQEVSEGNRRYTVLKGFFYGLSRPTRGGCHGRR